MTATRKYGTGAALFLCQEMIKRQQARGGRVGRVGSLASSCSLSLARVQARARPLVWGEARQAWRAQLLPRCEREGGRLLKARG